MSRASSPAPVRSRRPTPVRQRFSFSVPPQVQRAIFDLPELRDHWIAHRRLLWVVTAENLLNEGLSLNRSARALGLAASQLHRLLKLFRAGGFAALRPVRGPVRAARSGAVLAARRKPAPCRLSFELRLPA